MSEYRCDIEEETEDVRATARVSGALLENSSPRVLRIAHETQSRTGPRGRLPAAGHGPAAVVGESQPRVYTPRRKAAPAITTNNDPPSHHRRQRRHRRPRANERACPTASRAARSARSAASTAGVWLDPGPAARSASPSSAFAILSLCISSTDTSFPFASSGGLLGPLERVDVGLQPVRVELDLLLHDVLPSLDRPSTCASMSVAATTTSPLVPASRSSPRPSRSDRLIPAAT